MDPVAKEKLLREVQGAKSQTAVDYLLLDAASIAHAHFFSTRDPVSSEGDVPANGILGFYNTAQRLIARFKPFRIIVAFDGRKLARAEIYPGYQSRWRRFNPELRRQVGLIAPLSLKLGWHVCVSDRHETIDLAASAKRQCGLDESSMVFVTQDKRAVMLLEKNVGVVMRSHVIWDLVTHLDVSDEFGVLPSKVADVIALSGEGNVPGIFRLGRKTAAKLVNEFGSAERVYETLDKLHNHLREKLETQKAAFELGRKLTRLDALAPIDVAKISLEQLRFDREGVERFCTMQKLGTVLRRIDADYPLELWNLPFRKS
jgi:5'-3' exonuclease